MKAMAWLLAFLSAGVMAGPVQVGSKKFTEGVILGEITTQLLEARGVGATHRRELGGSRVLWSALLSGEIDVYPEYTGTLTEEILAGARKEGVLAAPINTMSEILGGEHVALHEMLVEQEHPAAGKVKVLGVPVKLSRTPGSAAGPAAMAGGNTREILADLGYSHAEIDELEAAKIVASHQPGS